MEDYFQQHSVLVAFLRYQNNDRSCLGDSTAALAWGGKGKNIVNNWMEAQSSGEGGVVRDTRFIFQYFNNTRDHTTLVNNSALKWYYDHDDQKK